MVQFTALAVTVLCSTALAGRIERSTTSQSKVKTSFHQPSTTYKVATSSTFSGADAYPTAVWTMPPKCTLNSHAAGCTSTEMTSSVTNAYPTAASTKSHKTRSHKTRNHKTRSHKTRSHKTRSHKTRSHKTRTPKTSSASTSSSKEHGSSPVYVQTTSSGAAYVSPTATSTHRNWSTGILTHGHPTPSTLKTRAYEHGKRTPVADSITATHAPTSAPTAHHPSKNSYLDKTSGNVVFSWIASIICKIAHCPPKTTAATHPTASKNLTSSTNNQHSAPAKHLICLGPDCPKPFCPGPHCPKPHCPGPRCPTKPPTATYLNTTAAAAAASPIHSSTKKHIPTDIKPWQTISPAHHPCLSGTCEASSSSTATVYHLPSTSSLPTSLPPAATPSRAACLDGDCEEDDLLGEDDEDRDDDDYDDEDVHPIPTTTAATTTTSA